MNRLGVFAGLCGFVTVVLGAFGAHGLEGRLTAEGLDWWGTATLYGLAHAVAALAVSMSERAGLNRAGWAFVIGAVIFSGSLYAMALGAPRWFGAITPVGGVSFLAGWTMIVFANARMR
ncbi:DUF423 domain-containing protein [Hyphococcus sp.]|uniref:DUF423 domain-containing protein n=1 Tax=Hyphococcus sp. TaxID=2038636 RepID=UPI0035C73807